MVRSIVNPTVSRAAALFGADDIPPRPLGGMDSAVYACTRAGHEFVLKLTPIALDDLEALRGEIEFAHFLGRGGLRVAQPLRSQSGELVTLLETPDQTLAVTAQEMAPGRPPSVQDPAEWNDSLFREWGRVTGQLHALSQAYTPLHRRPSWHAEHIRMAASCRDPQVALKWQRLAIEMEALAQEPDGYGLIHNDLHPWNYHLHDGHIVLFDLGSCCYRWWVADVAVALYWGLWGGSPRADETRESFAPHFIEQFMSGYAREHSLPTGWLAHLPLFLRYHQIYMLIYFTDVFQGNPQLATYLLRDSAQRVAQDEPVVELAL